MLQYSRIPESYGPDLSLADMITGQYIQSNLACVPIDGCSIQLYFRSMKFWIFNQYLVMTDLDHRHCIHVLSLNQFCIIIKPWSFLQAITVDHNWSFHFKITNHFILILFLWVRENFIKQYSWRQMRSLYYFLYSRNYSVDTVAIIEGEYNRAMIEGFTRRPREFQEPFLP